LKECSPVFINFAKQYLKMRKQFLLIISVFFIQGLMAQTLLTEAEDFHVKTIDGVPIWLFPLLDDEEQIVVIDFFSTSCGPCEDYADDFQKSYEAFGSNNGNVYHMGINWGNDNQGVRDFDSIFGLTYPTVSGTQGAGNLVFNQYQIQSYPTAIVINTMHEITDQYVWVPSEENLEEAIIAAGGLLVSTDETVSIDSDFNFYPNPVSNKGAISLLLKKAANVEFEIYDIMGKLIVPKEELFLQTGKHSISVPVNQLGNGVYFIKLLVGNNVPKTIRFVVDK
jgi:thiol-disulfide isomerase/thioredoxin